MRREVTIIDQDHDLDLAAEASPRSARELRVHFEQWLRAAGAAPEVTDDLGLAVYEALANAAEHAYSPDDPDPVVRLHARLDAGRVQIIISDRGAWSPPGDDLGYRGRGIGMMRHLTTDVDIDPGPQGTTVALRATLDQAGTEDTAS